MAITTNGGAGITADAVATLSNKTLEAPVINNATFTGQQAGLQIAFNDSIVFEGTTADAFETTLSAGDPTADRTVTLPNATTTLVGTDVSQTLTNKTINGSNNTITNVAISTGVSGLGTGIATALAVNTGSAGAPVLFDGALGTPSSGTLTNATGLPVSGISASTSAALGVGSIELGHATDTTIARASAGVVSIEGVNVVTTSSTDTLSNKTLTAPKFADLGFIADANGNELIILDTVTSAVNEVTLANAATGNAPTITASGGDTNIGITLTPKGSGNVTATALVYTQTLNTPTFSTNAYTLALTDQGDILLASNASTAGTINIPTNATVAFPVGTQITIVQTGSGQITIQATTSGTTTVNSVGATATAPKLRAQYSSATCVKTATDTWLVIGDIS